MKNVPIFFAAVLSQSVWAMPTMPDNTEQVGRVVRLLDAPMTMTDDSPRSQWNPQFIPHSSSVKQVKQVKQSSPELRTSMEWRKWIGSFFARDSGTATVDDESEDESEFFDLPPQYDEGILRARSLTRALQNGHRISHEEISRFQKYFRTHPIDFHETTDAFRELADEAMKADDVGIILCLLEGGAHLTPEQIQWATDKIDVDQLFKEHSAVQAVMQASLLNIRPLEIVKAAVKYHSHDFFGMDKVFKFTQGRVMDENDRDVIAALSAKNDLLLSGPLLAKYFEQSIAGNLHKIYDWKGDTKELILKYLAQGKRIDNILKHSQNWKAKELIIKTFQSMKLDGKYMDEVQNYFWTLEQLYGSLYNRRNYAVNYIADGLLRRNMNAAIEIYKYVVKKDNYLAGKFKPIFLNLAQKYLGEKDYEELVESVENIDLESETDDSDSDQMIF